ncbi:hypothetical protein [Mycetocola zhujimingii]|uniref:hypothetical protein n=1 Tax=Mycetocola zhujimingii TaxID=2079792 RepID=UPI0013C40484|nr:hypothetical protein [Mycetocola zhujimingii]
MAFAFSIVLFLVGIYLFALAFTVTSFQAIIFFAGIIVVSIAFAIPAHVLAKR